MTVTYRGNVYRVETERDLRLLVMALEALRELAA